METKGKKIGDDAYNLLWELHGRCYADGYDEFDELNDNILYQIQGLYDSMEDAEVDGFDGYEKEFQEVLDLANELDKFWHECNNKKDGRFNWIYG